MITHKLSVKPCKMSVQKCKRKFSRENNKVILTRVNLLRDILIIRKVDYLAWLSNVVLIAKSHRAPRMCIKWCMYEGLLSSLEHRSTYGCDDGVSYHEFSQCIFKLSLDTYKSRGWEKMGYITKDGTFCYRRIPFTLKMQKWPTKG